MNCLDVRRQKLIDPRAKPPELLEHLRVCVQCAEFTRMQEAVEAQLEESLRIAVDPALPARVVLRENLKRSQIRTTFARAAAVALALGLLLTGVYRAALPDLALLEAAVKHVAGEPKAMMSREARTQEELRAALSGSGVRVVKTIQGNIDYIHDCPVPGGLGKHIILKTGSGTITLLTMPNQKVRLRRSKNYPAYAVTVIPCKHGSIALIAASPSELSGMEQQLSQHLQWQG